MRWHYDEESGLIKWVPSIGTGILDENKELSRSQRNNMENVKREICWWVKNKDRFTQLRLRTCRTSDSYQQFKYDNGMIKLRRTDKFNKCIQLLAPYGKNKGDIMKVDKNFDPKSIQPKVTYGPCPVNGFGEILG